LTPGAQATQVELEVAPAALEYVPAAHRVQTVMDDPVDKLVYVPGGQLIRDEDPDGQYVPGTVFVMQVAEDVAPKALENVPPGHAVQNVSPVEEP